MATEIGIVKTLIGTATATAPDGSQRTLQVGDRVFQDEVITTGGAGAIEIELADGSLMTLGRDSQVALDEQVYDGQDPQATPADGDVDAIQQAILAGVDPTQVGEATAAGAGAGAGGNEGADFVQVLYEGPATTPDSGFETTGVSFSFDDDREEEEGFDDSPSAATTTVFLDEDDLEFTREELNQDFLAIEAAFEAATGLDARRSFTFGNDDVVDEFDEDIPGDDLPQDALTVLSGTLAHDFGNDGTGDIVFNAEGTQPAGLTSGGEAVQYWVSDDGHSLVAYVVREGFDLTQAHSGIPGTNTIIDTDGPIPPLVQLLAEDYAEVIFTAEITDPATGEFRVALYGPVDHPDATTEDNLLVDLGFTISDSDGDTAQGTLRLDIDDDSPIIENMSEDHGDNDSDSYVSNGLEIIHDESRGAQPTEGKRNYDPDPADDLFTKLFKDGSDAPVDLIGAAARPVEAGFFHSYSDGGEDYEYYNEGVLYDAGADGLKNLALTDAEGNPLKGKDSGLTTSDTGEAIYLYTIPAELLFALTGSEISEEYANYADNFVVGLTAPNLDLTDFESLMKHYESAEEAVGDIAFVVGLLEDVGYSYGPYDNDSHNDVIALLQLRAIQHPDTQDHDDMVSIEDLIHITITDNDGDSATQAITVSFDDDGPKLGGRIRTGRVDEEGLQPEGNAGDSYPYGDAPGDNLIVSRSLKIKWGADDDNVDGEDAGGDRTVAFVENDAPEWLTSNGEQVVYNYSPDGTVLTATADGVVVFTVTLSDEARGKYTFELKDNLDHPIGATEGMPYPQARIPDGEGQGGEDSPGLEDNIFLGFGFVATDADGDSVQGRFGVDIDDDAPVIGGEDQYGEDFGPENSIVDEEGLPTGNEGDSYDDGGDYTGDTTLMATGSLAISWGADDNNDGGDADRSVAFDEQSSPKGLTSDGVPVEYAISEDGTVLTATAGGDTVFVVTLSDLESGSYTFEQFDNLDHLGRGHVDTEDDINLTFAFTATDSDGDTASSSFMVTVDDDAPVIGEPLSADDGNSIMLGAMDGTATLNDWGVSTGPVTRDFDINGIKGDIEFIDDDKAKDFLKIYNNDANHIGTGSLADDDKQGINRGETLRINFDQLMQQAEIGVDGLGDHFKPEGEPGSQSAFATWVAYKNGEKVGEGKINNPDGDDNAPEGLLEILTISIPGGFDRIDFGAESENKGSNYEIRYVKAEVKHIVDEEGLPTGNEGDSYDDNGDVAGVELTTEGDLNILWGADDMQQISVSEDFEGGATGWTNNATTDAGELTEFLGRFSGSEPVVAKTYDFGADNAGREVTIEFDMYEIDSWDGARANPDDEFVVLINGVEVARDALDFQITEPGSTETSGNLFTGHVAHGWGPEEIHHYSFTATLDENGQVTLGFDATITQSLGDESFGIDNISITNADGRSVEFDAAQPGLAGLTSNGEAVTYSISADGETLTGTADGKDVFIVTLSDDDSGSYQFEQLDNLDHPTADTEDDLNLVFNYTATDSDGDTAGSSFTVTVDDDAPVATDAEVTATVDEDDIRNNQSKGNQPNDGDEVDGSTTNENEAIKTGNAVTTGSVAPLVNFGADEEGSFSLSTDVTALETQGLTSKGKELDYDVVGGTLTATAGNRTVFKLELDGNGDYTFRLVDQLDHEKGDGENNLAIDLSTLIVATDGDNDSITLDSGFTMNVTDDVPIETKGKPVIRTVEEEALDGGNQEKGDPTPNKAFATANVKGQVSIGADENATFSLSSDTTNLPDDLESDGDAVTYSVDDNVLTASAGGEEVFTLLLKAGGKFTFTLKGPLDHPENDHEDVLSLDLSTVIVATDFDGDSITLDGGDLIIRVVDDIPTLTVDGNDELATKVLAVELDETVGADRAATGESADGNTDDVAGALAQVTTAVKGGLSSLFAIGGAYGADGPGTTTGKFSFVGLPETGSLATTLSATNGGAISLSLVGGEIVGKDTTDDVVFTIAIVESPASSGQYQLQTTLFEAIDHGADDVSVFDEVTSLLLAEDGAVQLQYEVTRVDNDNDEIVRADTVDLISRSTEDVPESEEVTVTNSSVFSFDDDGPTLTVDAIKGAASALAVELDETVGADRANSPEVADGNTDDAAPALAQVTTTVAGGLSSLFTIGGDYGSDLAGDTTGEFSFVGLPETGSLATTLSATDGGAISLSLVGGEIVGKDTTDDVVFTIAIVESPASSGQYQLQTTLFEAIDHGADDVSVFDEVTSLLLAEDGAVQLQYEVTRVDGDGDEIIESAAIDLISRSTNHEGLEYGVVSDHSVFSFDDDGPVIKPESGTDVILLEEESAPTLTNAGNDEDEGLSYTVDGTIVDNVDWGSDGFGQATTFVVGNNTYDAGTTVYFDNDGHLGGDATEIDPALMSMSLLVNTDGTYTFTVLDNLDHSEINFPAGTDIQGENWLDSFDMEDILVNAVDGDGDEVAGGVILNVEVQDDIPTVSTNKTVWLDDDVFEGGNPKGPKDHNPDLEETSGTLSHSYGADGAGTVLLLDTGAPAGFIYSLNDEGTVVTVTQGGVDVLQIALTDTTSGAYTVTQLAPISHKPGGKENNQTFTVDYQVTDGDGDKVTGELKIKVDDDTPVLSVKTDALTVDEDGLVDANADDSRPGEVTGTNSAEATGNLADNFSFGADGAAAAAIFSVNGVEAVAGVITVETTEYRLEVEADSGDYTFTLLDNVLEAGKGENEQSLLAKLKVVAEDGDGDKVSGNIALDVTVLDDIPVISTIDNPMVWESFENLRESNGWHVEGEGGATFIGDNGVEWTVNEAGIEIQRGNVGGSTASDGEAHAELDAHDLLGDGGTTLTVVSTTVDLPNSEATLSFDYKPRPADQAGSDMKVTLGGVEVVLDGQAGGGVTIDPVTGVSITQTTLPSGWITVTLSFDGLTAGENTLSFAGLPDAGGGSNTLGAYIDNIHLDGNINLQVDETDLDTDDSADFSGYFTSSFGADGAGGLDYALTLGTEPVTGLVDTATQQAVVLSLSSGVIEGRTDTSDELVFTVSVDGNGVVTLDQIRAVDHGDDDNDHDSVVGLALDTLTLEATITDADGDEATSTLDLGGHLSFRDDGPIAGEDTVDTAEDTAITIDVLDNDTLSADGTVISSFTQPANGSVVLNEDNTFTFTPDANLHGQETFSYTLTDGDGDTSTTTVTVNVEAVADAPNLIVSVGEAVVTGSEDEIIPTTIDKDNLTGEGFTVTAYNEDGSVGTISDNSSPIGFGVAGSTDSGAASEIGLVNGRSESISVTFDQDISEVDVVLGWNRGGRNPEYAELTFKKDGVEVGESIILKGITDGIDGYGTLTPSIAGALFDEIMFSAPGLQDGDDDYVIHSIRFDRVVEGDPIEYSYEMNISASLTDVDGSESLSGVTIDDLPDGVSILEAANGDGTYNPGTLTLVSDHALSDDDINGITASVTSTESSNSDTATTETNAKVETDYIDFSALTLNSWDGSTQDKQPAANSVNANVLALTGNSWKAAALTELGVDGSFDWSNGTLTFEAKVATVGELQGILFDNNLDNNNAVDQPNFIKVAGTQSWGTNAAFDSESLDDGWVRYEVDLSSLSPDGTFSNIVFVNDDDAGVGGEVAFRNLSISDNAVDADADTDVLLEGTAGDDALYANAGDDILIGGAGNDILTGGDGADEFIWNSTDVGTVATPAHDIVTDFVAGDDVLNLTDLLSDGSHSIEGIDNGSGDLQVNIKDSGGDVVQEIELSGIATAGDASAALQSLLDSGAVDDGI